MRLTSRALFSSVWAVTVLSSEVRYKYIACYAMRYK